MAAATHNSHYADLLRYLNLQLRQAVGAARANSRQQAGLSVAVHQEHVAVFEAIRAQDAAAARHAAVGTFGKPPRDCSWRWRRTRRSAPLSRHRPDSFLTRPTFHR